MLQTIQAKHAAASDSVYGLLLMGVYLLADGLTSTTQERMFRGYAMSTYNQMLYTNIFSAGLSILGTARRRLGPERIIRLLMRSKLFALRAPRGQCCSPTTACWQLSALPSTTRISFGTR